MSCRFQERIEGTKIGQSTIAVKRLSIVLFFCVEQALYLRRHLNLRCLPFCLTSSPLNHRATVVQLFWSLLDIICHLCAFQEIEFLKKSSRIFSVATAHLQNHNIEYSLCRKQFRDFCCRFGIIINLLNCSVCAVALTFH